MAILKKTVSKPRPPSEYNPQIAARDARKIANNYTLKTKPLDVEGLVRALGLTLNRVPLNEKVSGYLSNRDGVWTVGVNALHHPNRQRFTIAHEIGHYLLHRDVGPFEDGLLFRREAQFNPREREANEFAALLLMPEMETQNVYRQNGNILDVAKAFGVSRQAAQYRLDNISGNLGIL